MIVLARLFVFWLVMSALFFVYVMSEEIREDAPFFKAFRVALAEAIIWPFALIGACGGLLLAVALFVPRCLRRLIGSSTR